MRDLSPTLLAHLQARRGLSVRLLFLAWPKSLATGLPVEFAIWTGDHDRDFTVAGVTRTYFGVSGLISLDPIVSAIGTEIRMQRATLSPLSSKVIDLFAAHNARLAPVEIHRAVFDPESRALLDEPHRLFKGWIDKAPITRPQIGGEAICQVTMASTARALTRTLTAKKSDATQSLRAGDRFRRYADISGNVDVAWGEKMVSSGSGTPTGSAGGLG